MKQTLGMLIVENVNKILNLVVVTYSFAQDLKITQKTVWNYLHKDVLEKKLNVWVPHE